MRPLALLIAVTLVLGAEIISAQQSVSPVRGWQKMWEFAMPGDTVSAMLVDIGGESGLRLVSLHTDRAKEDVLHLRIWKRAGEIWQTEWQSTLDPGELRGMVAGAFVKGSKGAQILTARNLILVGNKGYEKRTRRDEVSWFGYASLPEAGDVPIAAFPGGLWKGVINPDSRDGWLKFERVQADDLLSLPQQFADADWVVLTNSPSFSEIGDEEWGRQGYIRLFAQIGKRQHPDQPLLVTRSAGEGRQSLALVVPPSLSAPLRNIWQSEPIIGAVRGVQIVSATSLRGGLLVLVGNGADCRVQFWQIQRQGVQP
ncbi:MAG: hypothetical protein HPY54_14495 [Chthonomonadetes bacterium]|nr:hypothetical protein [Chthonomonadetes bacterium]